MGKTLATLAFAAFGAAISAGCTQQDYRAAPTPVPEAAEEASNPVYNVPAVSVLGEEQPYTQADLIRRGGYFIPYETPFPVEPSCLERQVDSYHNRWGIHFGIRPRVIDGKILGFAIFPKTAGIGYNGMTQIVMDLGLVCAMNR